MQTKKVSRIKRSRTRSGCFTCRDRHMKCDEQQPVCQNCINSKRKCYRGVRLNFLQYTIYDPKKAHPQQQSPLPEVKYYRILDQSIPVSSLYENGPHLYRPYKHLHSSDDLNDAHRIFFQDLHSNATTHVPAAPAVPVNDASMSLHYSSIHPYIDNPQPMDSAESWPLPLSLSDSTPFNFGEHTVLENFEIRNVLMNPQIANVYDGPLYDKDNVGKPMDHDMAVDPVEPPIIQNRKSSRVRSDAESLPEFTTTSQDAERFVHLIHTQDYSWLLDIFNETRIWSSTIPNFAVRLAQNAEQFADNSQPSGQRFLLDCLLLCMESTRLSRISELCQQQLHEWSQFASKDVALSTFTAFERLLVSVVLTTYALLIHTTTPGFVVSPHFKMILANQGRLMHQVSARFSRFSGNKFKRLPPSVMVVASFQALVLVRFFLRMRLQKVFNVAVEPISDLHHDIFAPLDLHISYTLHAHHDIAEYFTMSALETYHLKSFFQDFDLPQEKTPSDSSKLRLRTWALIYMDYFPEADQTQALAVMDLSEPKTEESAATVLVPNATGTAVRILAEYARKLSKNTHYSEIANAQLEDIFITIDHTFMSQNIKRNWHTYFGWAKH